MSTNGIQKIERAITTAQRIKKATKLIENKNTNLFVAQQIHRAAGVKHAKKLYVRKPSLFSRLKNFVRNIFQAKSTQISAKPTRKARMDAKHQGRAIETPKEMTPSFEAKWKICETRHKLKQDNFITDYDIEKNIIKTTQNNPRGWKHSDMVDYYKNLEKTSWRKAWETEQVQRAAQYTRPSDVHVQVKGPNFTDTERKAVLSYQDNYAYNQLLRDAEIDPTTVKEIKVMDEIVANAQPTNEECVVLRGFRTRKPWEPEKLLPFTKDLRKGNVITDPSFLSTARKDGPLLKYFDPILQIPNKEYPMGYVERMTVPAGSKFIDCGRGGMYSDEIIFGRNSMRHIDEIDDVNHVIYTTFLGYAK